MAANESVRFDIEGKNKTTRAFQQANRGLQGLTSSASKLGFALAGAFSVIAVGRFTKSTLESADAIGKFASRAGVTTDKIQKLRFAFELAGVGVEGVDKGLLNFGKRLGKARQDIGALAGGLTNGEEALLESLKATDNMSDALDLMFRAMGNAETSTRKLAIADAAFGISGLRMTAAFANGNEEFENSIKIAERLGLVIESSLIRNAEQLNDKMAAVTTALRVKLQTAFLHATPIIMRFNKRS